RITQIALMAAMADGQISAEEQHELASVANRLGVPAATTAIDQPVAARQGIGILAASLSDAEARRTAYEVALAVCTVDGAPNPPEQAFLSALHGALGLAPAATHEFEDQLRAMSAAPLGGSLPAAGAVTDDASLDQRILQQAMLTGALELLRGATGLAAGTAVTFAATYALGHAAKQYYAQGRKLSADDLRALFTRFQGEAQGLLPQVS